MVKILGEDGGLAPPEIKPVKTAKLGGHLITDEDEISTTVIPKEPPNVLEFEDLWGGEGTPHVINTTTMTTEQLYENTELAKVASNLAVARGINPNTTWLWGVSLSGKSIGGPGISVQTVDYIQNDAGWKRWLTTDDYTSPEDITYSYEEVLAERDRLLAEHESAIAKVEEIINMSSEDQLAAMKQYFPDVQIRPTADTLGRVAMASNNIISPESIPDFLLSYLAQRKADIEDLSALVGKAVPDEKDVEAVVSRILADPLGFTDSLRNSKRTPEMDALLAAAFGSLTEDELRTIYGQVPLMPIQDFADALSKRGISDMFLPGVGKWNMLIAGAEKLLLSLAEGKIDLTNPDNPLVKLLYKRYTDYMNSDAMRNTALRSIIAGMGDIDIGLSQGARFLGADGWANTLLEQGHISQNFQPQLLHDLDPDDWHTYVSKDFWSIVMARQIPVQLALLIPSLFTGGIVGGAVAGISTIARLGFVGRVIATVAGGASAGVIQSALESTFEAGGAYDEALLKGMTPEEADKVAQEVFNNNMKLLNADNVAQMIIAFAPIPSPLRTLNNAVSRGLVRVATVGGKMVVVGLTEGGEELFQDKIRKQALGEKFEWNDEEKLVVAIGIIYGGVLGAGGDIVSQFQQRAIKSLPAKSQETFNQAKEEAIMSGQTETQAADTALGTVYGTPEGKAAIDRLIAVLRIEANREMVFRENAPPMSESEKMAWEQTFDNQIKTVDPEGIVAEPIKLTIDYASKAIEYGTKAEQLGYEYTAKMKQIYQEGNSFTAREVATKEYETAKTNLETEYAYLKGYEPVIPRPEVGMPEAGVQTEVTFRKPQISSTTRKNGKDVRITIESDNGYVVSAHNTKEQFAEGKSPKTSDKVWVVSKRETSGATGQVTETMIKSGLTKAEAINLVKEQSYDAVKGGGPGTPSAFGNEFKDLMPLMHTGNLTIEQTNKLLDIFGKAISGTKSELQRAATIEMRKIELAKRVSNLNGRVQELIIEGKNPEDAVKIAEQEVMSGELPRVDTDFFSDLTQDMRNVLFGKVYEVLRNEPFELMSTSEALTNALLGKAIPREPGAKGGSAYSRLMRVFGEQPEIMKALDSQKPLQDIIEGEFRVPGQDPILLDQETLAYLRSLPTNTRQLELFGKPTKKEIRVAMENEYKLTKQRLDEAFNSGKIDKGTYAVQLAQAEEKADGNPKVSQYASSLNDEINTPSAIPLKQQILIVRALKETGATAVDIGNFLRANKASFDFSWWRQNAFLIAGHPSDFITGNIRGWKAMWSSAATEASWSRITQSYLYQIYDEVTKTEGDFLRPLHMEKGTAHWKGVEEYGFLNTDRPIPAFTEKIPWVKISSRGFSTALNEMNWSIFEKFYKAQLKIAEKIASGEKTLKPGESFSIEKNMHDFAVMLSDFTARGSLGKANAIAPTANAMFFALRSTIGRLMSPRHLISANPYVRVEAWKNALSAIGLMGSVILFGGAMGWWEVEKDSRSTDFMKIRIGNIRIDPWGGYQQFVVFFTRLFTQTGLVSDTGMEYKVDPLSAITNFIRGKASPLASLIADFWTGKTFLGETFDITNKQQWIDRVTPFALQDIWEAWHENPGIAALAAIPALVGASLQTYSGDWVDNFPKLGTPKYPDNLPYGITTPIYDSADFWSDVASQFKGVDPTTVTESKGFTPVVISVVSSLSVVEKLNQMPSTKLISINADPNKGDTYIQYYAQWQARSKITDPDKLKAFDADERTRNANLGNMSHSDYILLTQYWDLPESQREDFIKAHPELETNPRESYLTSHPQENALLALWGQADVLTKSAYDKLQTLIKTLDIPPSALSSKIPTTDVAVNYFKYVELVNKYGTTTDPEAKLVRMNDPKLEAWGEKNLGWKSLTDSKESLQIQVDYRTDYEAYNALDTTKLKDAYLESHPVFRNQKYMATGLDYTDLDGVHMTHTMALKYVAYRNASSGTSYRKANTDLDRWMVANKHWQPLSGVIYPIS